MSDDQIGRHISLHLKSVSGDVIRNIGDDTSFTPKLEQSQVIMPDEGKYLALDSIAGDVVHYGDDVVALSLESSQDGNPTEPIPTVSSQLDTQTIPALAKQLSVALFALDDELEMVDSEYRTINSVEQFDQFLHSAIETNAAEFGVSLNGDETAELNVILKHSKKLQQIKHIKLAVRKQDQSLPDALMNYRDLKTIALKGFADDAIWVTGFQWRTLSTLVLCDLNHITDLDMVLGTTKRLKHLIIRNCEKLECLIDESGDNVMPLLHYLEINNCYHLSSLPESLYDLTTLKSLVLVECRKLKHISSDIEYLSALRTLVIQSCSKMTSLPASLGKLVRLKSLVLDNLPLKKLNRSLFNITGLQVLELRLNEISRLPLGRLGKLINLTTLILDCTSLVAIPSSIKNLKKLENLEIKSGAITSLPKSLTGLPALQWLKIRAINLKKAFDALSFRKLEYLILMSFKVKTLANTVRLPAL